jgi:hypothetical protein
MAFLRVRDRGDHRSVILVETYRDDGKVKQRQTALGSFRFRDEEHIWHDINRKEGRAPRFTRAYLARQERREEKVLAIYAKATELSLSDDLWAELQKHVPMGVRRKTWPYNYYVPWEGRPDDYVPWDGRSESQGWERRGRSWYPPVGG